MQVINYYNFGFISKMHTFSFHELFDFRENFI